MTRSARCVMITSVATAVGLFAGAGLAFLWTTYGAIASQQQARRLPAAKPAQDRIPARPTKSVSKVAAQKRAVRVRRPKKRT